MVEKLMFLLVAFGAAAASSRAAQKALQNPDLYQGDIIGEDLLDRTAITDMSKRWKNGVMVYSLDPSVDNYLKDVIKKGMDNIELNTCIRFEKYDGSQPDYIRIFKGNGCYSNWGRTGGMQALSLGPTCEYIGLAIHELTHAIGFYHEQQRSDRDDYLTIYWENIVTGYESQFAKNEPEESWLINAFEYESIMIYGEDSFAKSGTKTMVAKQAGVVITNPYDKYALTKSDADRINIMYECEV